MTKLSLNLSEIYRVDLHLVKMRKKSNFKPILPNLNTIKRTRKGNKLSRFFRYIFENKRIGKLLGANLVAVSTVFSFLPSNSTLFSGEASFSTTQSPIVLSTKKGSVRYPLDNIKITQEFKFYHPGIDLDGTTGNPVYSFMNGVVSEIQLSNLGYGNAVIISHEGKTTSLYAHFSKILVNKNQEVTTTDKIGLLGATGQASGDHLHFEIRENGKPINPTSILP